MRALSSAGFEAGGLPLVFRGKQRTKAGFKGAKEKFIFTEGLQAEDGLWRDEISLFGVVRGHRRSPFL